MFRQLSLVVIALLLGALAAGSAEAQEIQRGKLKKIDVEKRMIVVTINGRDEELTLTGDTQVRGGQGENLTEKLRGFKEGSDVIFKAGERGGKRIVQGIGLAEPGKGAQPQAGSDGDGPRRGKVKKVDVEGRTITLTVGKEDVALALTDQSDIRGARGETLAERLNSLEPGTSVLFAAADRDGKNVLLGMMIISGVGDQPVSPEHAALKPLDELGVNSYQGYVGGLYPDRQNTRPREHEAAGLKLAARVRALDAEGKSDPAGKIVLLSVGMSNAAQSWQGFQRVLTGFDRKNPRLVLVNGADGGAAAAAIQNPDDGDRGAQYWANVDQRLKQAGATRAQVQAIWIKQADAGPREGFPGYAIKLQSELTRIVQIFPQRFPNAKLVYLSSRTYGGFATTTLNPEPYAYESGFAVKWLIEEQLKHNPALNYDASRGPVKAPWLSWGPYWWANGQNKRSADGLSWEQDDFVDDGTHQSEDGQRKVGQLLLDFFRSDSTTRAWFNRRQADALSSSEQTRHQLQPVSD